MKPIETDGTIHGGLMKQVVGRMTIVTMIVVVFAACGSTRQYATSLRPCARSIGMDPQLRAYASVALALEVEQWDLLYRDPVHHKLHARKCYYKDHRNCANLVFSVSKYGVVNVFSQPGQPVRGNLVDDLQWWMVRVKQEYAKRRCRDDAELREEMKRFGFEM